MLLPDNNATPQELTEFLEELQAVYKTGKTEDYVIFFDLNRWMAVVNSTRGKTFNESDRKRLFKYLKDLPERTKM